MGNPSNLPRQKPELKWSPAPVVIFGLGVKGPWTSARAIRPGRQRVGGRVNNERVHADALVDCLAELWQPLRRMVAGVQPQGLSDLAAFLLVQAQDDVEVLLEGGDQLQGAQDVCLGALLGIGEVNEQLAARAFHAGANLLEHGGPDVAHVGEHGPVDEADQVGAAELGGELVLAEPGS